MISKFNFSKRSLLRDSILTVSGLLFSSCLIQINGISLSKDYKHLPEYCKEQIVESNLPLDSLRYDGNVYLITTDVLLSQIEHEDSSLVYIWTPYCKSDACSSPQMFEEYCQAHGYRPYIILDQYTEWHQYYNGKSRLLMFDPKQWDTNSCHKYIDNIDIALTGSVPKANNYASYHFYSKGQHVKSMRYLE